MELPEQFQLNPADLLAALARRVTDAGGVVVEGARVTDLTADDEAGRVTVTTTAGDMTAGQVVLATATPILDTGATTMSLVPERSYLCAYEPAPGSVLPDGMFLSTGSPGVSLRTYLGGETPRLLVGGAGHRTGQSRDTNEQIADIDAWTQEHFPGARRTHGWSAQDYHPVGMVPLAETMSWGGGRVHFAGAYSKWGMTGAPAAAPPGRRPRPGTPGTDQLRFPVGRGLRHEHGHPASWSGGRPGQQPGRHGPRSRTSGQPGVPAHGWDAGLERRRAVLGLPVARFPFHRRRHAAGRTGDPRPETSLNSSSGEHNELDRKSVV